MMSGVMCQVRLPRLLKPDSVFVKVLRVEVVEKPDWQPPGGTPAWKQPKLDSDAAGGGVVELEVARAGGEGQNLRNEVEVDRGEESGLLGFAHRVLIEGDVVALHARIHDGRAGECADVAEAAGVATASSAVHDGTFL